MRLLHPHVHLRAGTLLGLLWFCSLAAHGQAGIEVRRYFSDSASLVKEVFTVTDTVSNVLQGPYTSYYSNGRVESQGYYRRNEADGLWEYFYENGNPKMRGEFKASESFGHWVYYYESGKKSMEGPIYDGQRQDLWKFYFESGEIKSEGHFLDNKRVGVWNYFYEDGKLKAQAFYENGRGTYREFYPSGITKAEGINVDGRSDSVWHFYYDTGELQALGNYRAGIKDGDWTYYYPNGNTQAEGTYINGEVEGKWTYYHEDGSVSSEGALRNGRKEGFWKIYDPGGAFKGEGVFENGQGEYREYYESGKLKVKGYIDNDRYEGPWTYYYEDGTLEGEAIFTDGLGEYVGYYPDGTMKVRGTIENGVWVGEWELFDEKGRLAGYYRPVYEEDKPVMLTPPSAHQQLSRIDYDKPEFRFRAPRFRYFNRRPNEFVGLAISTNPAFLAVGYVPLGIEIFFQERLGYEVEAGIVRRPFYASRPNLPDQRVLTSGAYVGFLQKFYSPERPFGMVYFGHALRYTYHNHYAYDRTISPVQAMATGQKVEYSVLVGDRFTFGGQFAGFTLDFYLGGALGYRSFSYDAATPAELYSTLDVPKTHLAYSLRLGAHLGWMIGPRQ